MTLHSRHFHSPQDLCVFVNANHITGPNILKIDADAGNGGWVIWWYA